MHRLRTLGLTFALAATPSLALATVIDDVVRKINACSAAATTGEQQYSCLLKATPRKCRNHLRDRRMTMSLALRQQWQTCLATCEGASLYSRTFGPCSTPSDPNK